MNKIVWKPLAVKQFKKLSKEQKSRISLKVDGLVNFPNVTNVKPLKNHKYDYRLRVGNYRVLFNYENEIKIIAIEEVKKRDERTY